MERARRNIAEARRLLKLHDEYNVNGAENPPTGGEASESTQASKQKTNGVGRGGKLSSAPQERASQLSERKQRSTLPASASFGSSSKANKANEHQGASNSASRNGGKVSKQRKEASTAEHESAEPSGTTQRPISATARLSLQPVRVTPGPLPPNGPPEPSHKSKLK